MPDSISIPCLNTIVSLFDVETSNFKVYPNPTNGKLVIGGETSRLELYDTSGKRLLVSNENSIQLSGLSNGLYILNVLDKFGNTYKYKVLKE